MIKFKLKSNKKCNNKNNKNNDYDYDNRKENYLSNDF